MRILDAGCGSGRNLIYLLCEGYEVLAADADAAQVERVRRMAQTLAPSLPESNFRIEPAEQMWFDDGCMDVVLSSAVLHFARDDAHFEAMLSGSWRVLKPGGLIFCRLVSSIAMENRLQPIQGRRCKLPDASERYVVDEALLDRLTERMGGMVDPLKTTVVQDMRAMTT